MHSLLRFSWKRPISFTSEFSEKLDRLFGDFSAASYRDFLEDRGLDIKEFPTVDELTTAEQQSDKRVSYSTRMDAERIFRSSWDVKLKDGTNLQSISTDQLLSLRNVAKSSVKNAIFSNSSSNYSINIDFDNATWTAETTCRIKAPLQMTQTFRIELEELLSLATQPWWIMRNGKAQALIFAPLLLAANILSIADVVGSGFSQQASTKYITLFIMGLGFSFLLIAPIVTGVVNVWNWIFPMIEFRFGGGVQISEMRKNVRKALWGVPILSVLIPYLVNQLD